ncbi:thioredoxin [Halorubellus sp. PRR65]|uniref:thioredoxin n=1 Tax=Halorubellus sp. PRR65 TaxID=3098148 RepID=UPI002B2579DA|nr:thioredoxin [Halorubellus sp. PRR65]
MTETDERETIREQKRRELQEKLGDGGEVAETSPEEARPDAPVHVEGADHLSEVTDAHEVVLVDFYADWCGPCKMVEPVVEALHDDGTAVVAKVDIDEHQALAQRQNVRGVPTMLLYVDGTSVERVVGAKDKASLEALVAQHA